MRVVCISDTHGKHDNIDVPSGDILLCAGDVTPNGDIGSLHRFISWMSALPHAHKITIAGNHDWCFQKQGQLARDCFEDSGIVYLEDECAIIDGFKFYGSPWQPAFCNWAFNLPRGEKLSKVWSFIPDDVNVLITHGPPIGILDKTRCGDSAGCEDLLGRINNLNNLKLHLFGHIHEAYGEYRKGNKIFINASNCTLMYKPKNPPIVVDL